MPKRQAKVGDRGIGVRELGKWGEISVKLTWNKHDKLFRFVVCGITTLGVFAFRINIMVKLSPRRKLQFIMVIALFMHGSLFYYWLVPIIPCIFGLSTFLNTYSGIRWLAQRIQHHCTLTGSTWKCTSYRKKN